MKSFFKSAISIFLATLLAVGHIPFGAVSVAARAEAINNVQLLDNSKSQIYFDGTYLSMCGKTFGEIKKILGEYHASFAHASRYDVYGPDLNICYEFQDSNYAWTMTDSDKCIKVSAPLIVLIPNIGSIVDVWELVENLKGSYNDVSAEIKQGAGTVYYIADRYALIKFSGTGYSATLQIPVDAKGGITVANGGSIAYSFTWLQVVSGEYYEAPDYSENTQKAIPSCSTILVNGSSVAFNAYLINNNNYFKLRDLTYVLNGTEKQFSIWYEETSRTVYLDSGYKYTPIGGEMAEESVSEKSAKITSQRIFLNGKQISLTTYNIDGNNYIKLRDLGASIDFEVDWDGVNNTIVIDTSRNYTAD